MRTLVALAALAAALSACSQGSEQAADDASASSMPEPPTLTADEAAGTWDYTLPDGSAGTTVLAADGSFTDTLAEQTVSGSWDVTDGKLCIDPAGDAEDQVRKCYVLSAPDGNGTQVATSDTGEQVKVFKHPT